MNSRYYDLHNHRGLPVEAVNFITENGFGFEIIPDTKICFILEHGLYRYSICSEGILGVAEEFLQHTEPAGSGVQLYMGLKVWMTGPGDIDTNRDPDKVFEWSSLP